jgi:replicative DNA helicase
MHGSVVSIPPAASRIPPQSIELEQAVLGAILINNDAFHRVSDFLEPRHFAEPVHRRIFELCVESIAADRAATPITLKTSLPPDEIAGLYPWKPISYFDLERGKIDDSDWDRIEDTRRLLHSAPLVIEEPPAVTVSQVAARARREQQRLERQDATLDAVAHHGRDQPIRRHSRPRDF